MATMNRRTPRSISRTVRTSSWIGFAAKCSLALAAILVALSASELIVRYAYYSAADRRLGSTSLWLRYRNMYVDPLQDNGCTYSERMFPHPYLLKVLKRQYKKCGPNFAQARGLESRYPFPFERDPRYFSVLVLGGSVADLLAMGRFTPDGGIWLEQYLNEWYRSPNGKPFRVFSGALGGWGLPIQNNVITLFGDSFDAFVALDGYNETLQAKQGVQIDYPLANEFVSLTASGGPLGLRLIWWLQRYRRFCVGHDLPRHSFLAYFLFEKSISFLGNNPSYQGFIWRRLGQYFQLPSDWNKERVTRWNRKKYETYIRLQAAQARALGARYAHFVQPVHEIDKTLTEDEKLLPSLITPQDYYDVAVPASEDLRREGLSSFLLLDVFKGVSDSIYVDQIHCHYLPSGENPGYDMISRRMAQRLGDAWHLHRK